MAQLSANRKSYVHQVSDWPRGTYRRKWGFLHDQVWFPVADLSTVSVMNKHPDTPIERFNGKLYDLYLDRRMLWTPWFHIRLHKFYQGDDDAAPHDHPWWFITIPFSSYTETVFTSDGRANTRKVRAFIPHFRRGTHRHFVHHPREPFRTLILTGRLKRNWGFWPRPDKFIPHREWSNYNRRG